MSLAALRRLAIVLGCHFLEEEGDDLVDTIRRVRVRARDDVRVRRHAGREPADRDPRGSLLSALVRELPGIDIRVVANRADRPEPEPLTGVELALGAPWRSSSRSRSPSCSPAAGAPRRRPVPEAPADPRPVLRQPRPGRAPGRDPHRARRGGGARTGVSPDRPAALRRGLAAPRPGEVAMPLLEAVEHAALRAGVPSTRGSRRGGRYACVSGSGRSRTSTGSSRRLPRPDARDSPRRSSRGSSERADRDARAQAHAVRAARPPALSRLRHYR